MEDLMQDTYGYQEQGMNRKNRARIKGSKINPSKPHFMYLSMGSDAGGGQDDFQMDFIENVRS